MSPRRRRGKVPDEPVVNVLAPRCDRCGFRHGEGRPCLVPREIPGTGDEEPGAAAYGPIRRRGVRIAPAGGDQ